MPYSENSTLRELMADERARAVVEKHLPGASTHPQLPEAMYMTLREVSFYPESGLTQGKLEALVADLADL